MGPSGRVRHSATTDSALVPPCGLPQLSHGRCIVKIKTLAVLAGMSAPLIVGGSASGGFVGIETASKPNEFGIFTVNVYAVFDRHGEDLMSVVAGTPLNPLTIEVIGGTFYQHQFGTDRPPSGNLVDVFPSLAYDTFVTIAVKCVGDPPCQPIDNMAITASFPGFGPSVLMTSHEGWAITPIEPAADPFNPDFFAGDGRVLIGQFSTVDGSGIEGTMLLQYTSNNVFGQSVVSFQHMLDPPCPFDCGGDNDGNVGITDFLALLANWGPCP